MQVLKPTSWNKKIIYNYLGKSSDAFPRKKHCLYCPNQRQRRTHSACFLAFGVTAKKVKKVLSKALIAACHSRAAPEGTRASWAQGQFCDCDLTSCAYCHWQTLYKGLICVLTVHVLSAGQRGSSSCRPVALPAKRDMHLEACVALLQFYLCQ